MQHREFNTRTETKPSLSRQVVERQRDEHEAKGASLFQCSFEPVISGIGDASSADLHASMLNRATNGRPSQAGQSLLRLQRQYGNRYVQRMLALDGKGRGETEAASEVEESIQQVRGGGHGIDSRVRGQMESAFDANFGNVRLHTDTRADTLNRELNARAFTTGQDIFFRQGDYNPGSSGGRELIAHELTHVVQQNGAVVQAKLTVNYPSDIYEQEADQVARSIMQGDQQTAHQIGINIGNVPQQGMLQRDVPIGTLETSEGVQEIEGSEIISSASAIRDRLVSQEGNINVYIQGWTEDGVGDLRDGIQDAANSFKLWYDERPRRPNTAEFVMDVASAALSVIGTFFPAYGLAFAVAGSLLSLSKGPIKNALDPNADPNAQARQLQQNMVGLSSRIDIAFNDFGPQLKRERLELWSDIGTAITMAPPLLSIAREELYTRAGVPAINQPYGQQILSQMIFTYTDWERMYNLQQSTFFISSESVEYSLFTEDVRRRLRREGTTEAGRRLGAPEE